MSRSRIDDNVVCERECVRGWSTERSCVAVAAAAAAAWSSDDGVMTRRRSAHKFKSSPRSAVRSCMCVCVRACVRYHRVSRARSEAFCDDDALEHVPVCDREREP